MNAGTGEFAFYLAPSTIQGVGIFAAEPIMAGMSLNLWSKENLDAEPRKKEDIPIYFQKYCVQHKDGLFYGPKDFGRIEIGYFINHSKTPNAAHKDFNFYAIKNIEKDEELTVNYNSLDEPEPEDYYK